MVELGGPRQRLLLAILALQPGVPIGRDRLIDGLWSDDPPDGAWTTVRSYVSRLRRALGDERAVDVASDGYALRLESHRVDALRFDALVKSATSALDRRRFRSAARLLDEALSLWGAPFGELAAEPALQAEAARLEELRLYAHERRFEARLELGRSAELVDELERLVAEEPHRERLWRHLLLALYRAGRQADALAAYHRARQTLDDQLGIEPGPELQGLQAAILRHEVDPPAVARRERSTIATPLTTFIGRDEELDVVTDLLASKRLVTLVGVGGAGKTRLAMETARRVEQRFSEGSVFVDLAAIRDPSHVAAVVAAAVGAGTGPRDVDGRLAASLHDIELLVVLDNCEHLLDAVSELAQSLLRNGPDVRVLATSREVLGVPGEVAHAVGPLQSPAPDAPIDVIRRADAVRLLLDRVERPAERITDDLLRTAAQICGDLDGLPLAIELAAARSTVLTLDEIASRLDDRFRFLVSWRRLAPARHRTLREAMDWSFDLLDPGEQRVLQGLSVFGGTFRLDAVSAVCLDGDTDQSLRFIEHLVAASLVVPVETSRGMRFRLLETVREYATSKLPEPEAQALRRRLALHVRDLVHDAHLAIESPGVADYQAIDDELANIRAVLAWSQGNDPALGLDIACLLELYWAARAPSEGFRTLTALLEHPVADEGLLARGIRCAAACRYMLGEFDAGIRGTQQALVLYRKLGDDRAIANLLVRIAGESARVGDAATTRALIAEARAASDDPVPADEYDSKIALAKAERADGRFDLAIALLREAADLAGQHRDPWFQAIALSNVADTAIDLGRTAEAEAAAREELDVAAAAGDRQQQIYAFANLAIAAAMGGDELRSGRMWGALLGELDRGGVDGQWELDHEAAETKVRALVGTGFDLAVAQGRRLALDDAVAEGVGGAAHGGAGRHDA